MKKPKVKLKPFKAWCGVDKNGVGDLWLGNTRRACRNLDEYPVRVIVRDARDDSEARTKRENARLRKALRDARAWMIVGRYGQAHDIIVKARERRDRR